MLRAKVVVLAPVLAMFWATATPAQAQSLLIETLQPQSAPRAQPETEAFQDWEVTCPVPSADVLDAPCTVSPSRTAYDGTNGVKRLYGRLIAVAGQPRPVPVFIIEIELGYLLPEGATLTVDSHSLGTLAVRSCHPDGCLLPFRLTAQLKTAFRRGRLLQLALTTLEGETERLSVSLLGFTRALEALVSKIP